MSSGDGYIRVGADVREAMEFFDSLDVNKKQIQKAILKEIGRGAISHEKSIIGTKFKRGTGSLKRSLTTRISRSCKSVIISNNATSAKGARYGFIQAAGWDAPKKGEGSKLMTFKIGDKWVRTYHTHSEPRDWIKGPIESWTNSADYHGRVDKALQKQIDYWDKRIQKGYAGVKK